MNMNERVLVRIKRKLKELFTKIIRICQKIANKLPDCSCKVTILQQLAKAKKKLNDTDKMTTENGGRMSKELQSDAVNIQETIERTMKKYDKSIDPHSSDMKWTKDFNRAEKFAKKHSIKDEDRSGIDLEIDGPDLDDPISND